MKMRMQAPLKLHTNWLKMSLLNLKPGLDQPTEGKLDEKTSPTAWKESF